MSVKTTIVGMLDYIAMVRHNMRSVTTGGTGLWARVDACGDELFENTVKGTDMTNADTCLSTGAVWGASKLAKIFTLLDTYLKAVSVASPYIGTYLSSFGLRAPYDASEAYYDRTGVTRLPAANVYAPGLKPADKADPTNSLMHRFGTWASTGATAGTWTEDDGEIDTTKYLGAPVVAINLAANQTASLVLRCYKADGVTYKDITVAFAADDQYTQKVAGEAALTSAANAGATSIASTGVLAAGNIMQGEKALIYESDSLQEIITVGAVTTNAVAVAAGIKNTYTTAAKIYPLFTNSVAQSVTGATNGQSVDAFALPDRTIAL